MDNETVQRLQTALKELRESGIPVAVVLMQEKVASGSEIAGTDPTEMAQQFFIEEYKALREEIKLRIDETTSSERYFLIASAAVYVWLSAVQLGLDATAHNRQN